MSLFDDKLKKITLKETLSLILILFIIQYLINSLNFIQIDTIWIYIFIIFFFIFKLRDEIFNVGEDISQAFQPKILKTVFFLIVLNVFFSYGMLYFSDFILNVIPKGNLFNSILTTGLIASVFISPISEELIFRGVFLNRLQLVVPPVFAVLISSLLFASLHGFGTIFSAFIFGICASILYLKTKNIFIAIMFHFLNNLFAEIIVLCDSSNILFTDGLVILAMSVLAVISFIILLVFIIRQLKVLNNDEL